MAAGLLGALRSPGRPWPGHLALWNPENFVRFFWKSGGALPAVAHATRHATRHAREAPRRDEPRADAALAATCVTDRRVYSTDGPNGADDRRAGGGAGGHARGGPHAPAIVFPKTPSVGLISPVDLKETRRFEEEGGVDTYFSTCFLLTLGRTRTTELVSVGCSFL